MVLAAVLPQRRNALALAWIASFAAIAVSVLSIRVLLSGHSFHIVLWTLPDLGTLMLSLDRLSALFVLSAGIVFFAASAFSAAYMERYLGHYSLRSFSILYYALFLSVVLVLMAGDVLSFLIAWEAMAISSYLLVNYEHEREANIHAGWLMLALSEAGSMAAAFALMLLANQAHTLDFSQFRTASAVFQPGMRWAVFLLSFLGFGVKAGLVPFSVWLPRAHPAAPANVSAILSGVILNLGIYGIVRVNIDFLPITLTGPGLLVLIVGSVSALIGILYATVENDLKTMLAHSSIENMGIITAALGAGFIFAASGHKVLASIAFVAALYHMLNHSVYKALLFLGVGTVDMRVGIRSMDRLGGLITAMPWTGLFFLAGALSISALPPFNGFVSEWLILQSLLRSVELHSTAIGTVFAFCAAILALTAGLAITCFVKAFAMTFLGLPRSKQVDTASEARRSMTIPMGALAALCIVMGIIPTYMIPVLDRTLAPYALSGAAQALVPPFFSPSSSDLPPAFVSEFHDLGAQVGKGVIPASGLVVLHRGEARNPVVFAMSTSYTLVVLIFLLGVVFAVVRLLLARGRKVVRRLPWDGGIQRLLPEMTYTATGFSSPVSVIFDAILHPTAMEETRETIYAHFRTAIRRGSREEAHILERMVFQPLVACALAISNFCARMHNGKLNAYVTYVLVVLLAVLLLTV
jgi:hydrogenase-4 component B